MAKYLAENGVSGTFWKNYWLNSFHTWHLSLWGESLDPYTFSCSQPHFRLSGGQIFGWKWGLRIKKKQLLVPFITYLAFTLRNLYWIFLDEWLVIRVRVYCLHLWARLVHYVPAIVSSWNFQDLLPLTKVISMQVVKVRGQRSRSPRSKPYLAVSGL